MNMEQRTRNMKYITASLLLMLGASSTKAFQMNHLPTTKTVGLSSRNLQRTLSTPVTPTYRLSPLQYQDKDGIFDDIVDNMLSPNIHGALRSPSTLAETAHLQSQLLAKIGEFKALREQSEDPVTSSKTKTPKGPPQKIDFYSISKEVGDKVQEIVQLCNEISKYNPTAEPTKLLGNKNLGGFAPLNGPWRSLFTTAADANFPKKEGQATAPKVQNIVDAKKGTITNVVDFPLKADGSEPTFKQLNVVIGAKPVTKNRVELQFKYAKAILTKLLWFKVNWTLFIPVPPPFVVRCLVSVSRFVKGFGKKKSKLPPKGFFDVLYLDDNLRVHKTGEDNYFVQARENWGPARKIWVD